MLLLPWSSDDGGWVGSLRSLDICLCCTKFDESCSSAGTKFSNEFDPFLTDRCCCVAVNLSSPECVNARGLGVGAVPCCHCIYPIN